MSMERVVTFGEGPLGLGLVKRGGAVVVSSVDVGGAASSQNVHVGDAVLAVSGEPTRGLSKAEVLDKLRAASRPLTLLVLGRKGSE